MRWCNLLKINNFIHRRIGGDSRLQAFRDVLEYNNLMLSTKICFGLGEGITFKYWLDNYSKIPQITITGRKQETEHILCKTLGIGLTEREETNTVKAKMILISRLDKQLPTIIDVDRNALEYIPDNLKYDINIVHSMVVIGYDEEKDTFAVMDSFSDDPIWISSNNIEKVRNSISILFPLKNRWYDFDFNNCKSYVTINKYYSSVKSVCINMKSKLFDTGITGMKNFFEEFNKTTKLLQNNNLNDTSKEAFKLNLQNIGMQIKYSEASNSFYRDMYADYLKRLYLFTDIEFFNKYSIKCNKIAIMWRKLGEQLCNESESLINKASYFLKVFSEIIDMEEEFFINLYEGLNQIYH